MLRLSTFQRDISSVFNVFKQFYVAKKVKKLFSLSTLFSANVHGLKRLKIHLTYVTTLKRTINQCSDEPKQGHAGVTPNLTFFFYCSTEIWGGGIVWALLPLQPPT